ncbi:MAG: hypothetical protein BWX86_00585 [Verrucomicrobia bacterium ADurb.Bin122]|nr:MAG: hypothetical protein BWX86_00585 [Verrucomicrobia bacterium ADurb.Bin122]
MRIIAIDPGTERSAWVVLDNGRLVTFAYSPNAEVAATLAEERRNPRFPGARLAIEMMASLGLPVGREVFETCVWIGRFIEAFGGDAMMIYRSTVKANLCHSNRANDSTIRAALIDRFGPGKAAAIGTRGKHGPLYGVTGDVWQALAVAVTAHDRLEVDKLQRKGVMR